MPTRVMLVDDAVVVRRILKDALSQVPGLEVVGTASDGVRAMESISAFNPDVVVLDVEMPNMDGIETLAAIKKSHPHVKVIMFSTLTGAGAQATMDALMLGADDYVTKPANVGSVGAAVDRIRTELAPKIKALHRSGDAVPAPTIRLAPQPAAGTQTFTQRPAVDPTANRPSDGLSAPRPSLAERVGRPHILTIAVSTGGPNALAVLLPMLPADLAVPVVIVQHIPPMFSRALADRLNTKCALHVAEATSGAVLKAGDVWIAPGDFHMVLRRTGTATVIETNQGPPENSCRPAADVLFRSVSEIYGRSTLGLVLTGMGSDGLKGAQTIVANGGHILAQDEATSVVWGMPGAVAAAGIAEAVMPLEKIAAEIVRRVGTTTKSPASVGQSLQTSSLQGERRQ